MVKVVVVRVLEHLIRVYMVNHTRVVVAVVLVKVVEPHQVLYVVVPEVQV